MFSLFRFLKAVLNVRLTGCLADQVMAIHWLISITAAYWALISGQAWLSVTLVALWLLAFVLWLEFKHGG